MISAAFQQSAFLQSLGWAIANSIWQAGFLWVLYQAVVSSYTTATAKFKNNLSTVILFSSFIWFAITFLNKLFYLQSNLSNSLISSPIYIESYFIQGNISLQNFLSPVFITFPYLSFAYLVLLLIFAIRLINSYRYTNFIRKNGLQQPAAELILFMEKVAGNININKKIKLWISTNVDVPATIGFLRPVILIPMATLNQLSPGQLEAIILHELSHIKRNDYLINLFISLIETILFFNPFIVMLGNIIEKERENCCDDFVLKYKYDRHSYACALLSLEKHRNEHMGFALTATSGRRKLLFRIKRIMDVKTKVNGLNYGQKLLALLIVAGLIGSVAWLSPQQKNQDLSLKQISKRNISTQLTEVNKKQIANSKSKKEINKNHSNVTRDVLKENQVVANTDPFEKNVEKNNFAFNGIGNEVKDDVGFSFSIANDKNNAIKKVTDNSPFSFNLKDLQALPNSTSEDFDFLKNLNLNIEWNKLKAEVEKNKQSLSLINFNEIQNEIVASLAKIKMPPVSIVLENSQNTPEIPGDIQNIENSDPEILLPEKNKAIINTNILLNKIREADNEKKIRDIDFSSLQSLLSNLKISIDTRTSDKEIKIIKSTTGHPINLKNSFPAEPTFYFNHKSRSVNSNHAVKAFAKKLTLAFNKQIIELHLDD